MEQPPPPTPIMTTASGSKTQWAKPEDWERYRHTITALFMYHSLPVVIRIMRDEHQFRATPKMFQTQIYQKWGLRKSKSGEPAEDGKRRKRRREDLDDGESVASDDRSRGPPTAETLSPTEATALWRSYSDDSQTASAALDDQAMASVKGESSQAARGREGSGSSTTTPESQAVAPRAWTDFLSKSYPSHPPPGNDRDAPAFAVPEPQTDSKPFVFTEGTVVPANDSGSWKSTVVIATPPNSVGNSGSRVPSTTKSRSSHSSGGSQVSRVSRISFPDEVISSSSSDSQRERAKAVAAVRRPMGSIHNLEPPKTLLLPEKSMFYARHFISNKFSTGIWALSQSTDPTMLDTECGKLERWYNDFNPAFDCLREEKLKSAFRFLKRCFANTKTIIEPQDPRVVIYVCQQAMRCMFYDTLGRNLSQTLLRYITGLCQVLFGVQHPLYIMLEQLSRMESFEFAQNIRPFMDCYFDHLEPFLEQSNNAFGHITEMRGLTVSLMEATGMMGVYEAKPVLDGLARKAESHGIPSLHLKIETAAMLQRNRFFKEALSLLSEVRESEEARTSPYEFVYAGIVLILTLRKMKNGDGAITAGYELVDFLSRPPSSYLGFPDELSMSVRQYMESRQSSLLLVLGKLEKDLRDAGRIDEANKIQDRLDRGVVQEYGIEEVDEDPEADVNAYGMKS